MEMTGVAEAAQFINVSINGTETILKLTGSFVHFAGHEIKELIGLLVASYKDTKNNKGLKKGEVKLSDLMSTCSKNHEKLGCIQIDERLKEEFIKFCNDNKLTYSFLIDVNKNDTCIEAVYRGGQAAAFESFLASRYPLARPYSLEEYRNNATPEGLAKAEEILKEAEEKLISVPIDKGQITGVSEKEVEVCVSDNDDKESFLVFPRERLTLKGDKCALSVADNDFLEAYDKSAFQKTETGNIVKMPDPNRKLRGKINGEYIREMISLEYAKCLAGKHTPTDKTFVNKLTGDVKAAATKAVDISTVIDFPGRKR